MSDSLSLAQERDRFEAWLRRDFAFTNHSFKRNRKTGDYRNFAITLAWKAWLKNTIRVCELHS